MLTQEVNEFYGKLERPHLLTSIKVHQVIKLKVSRMHQNSLSKICNSIKNSFLRQIICPSVIHHYQSFLSFVGDDFQLFLKPSINITTIWWR